MNIYLVGYRCCGKSSLGRLLAERLGWRFADTDALLIEQTGQEIDTIVKAKGWSHFRQLERACLAAVATRRQRVVATGGGIVLDIQNVRVMQGSGVVVWLKAAADVIRQRMAGDPATANQRPALTNGNARDEIEDVLQERIPLYRAASNIALDTGQDAMPILVRDLEILVRPFLQVAEESTIRESNSEP